MIDYDYLVTQINNILSFNFGTISTGWSDLDEEMDDPVFRNIMDTLELYINNEIKTQIKNGFRVYKMRKISKQIKRKHVWDIWMHHWLDPNNKEGYIKYLCKTDNVPYQYTIA